MSKVILLRLSGQQVPARGWCAFITSSKRNCFNYLKIKRVKKALVKRAILVHDQLTVVSLEFALNYRRRSWRAYEHRLYRLRPLSIQQTAYTHWVKMLHMCPYLYPGFFASVLSSFSLNFHDGGASTSLAELAGSVAPLAPRLACLCTLRSYSCELLPTSFLAEDPSGSEELLNWGSSPLVVSFVVLWASLGLQSSFSAACWFWLLSDLVSIQSLL